MRKLLIVSLLLISGCQSTAYVESQNKSTLEGNGVLIGKLKDGREVRRFDIEREQIHKHYIYLIEDTDVINVNHDEPAGKHSRVVTEVIIDGKHYVEKETK